MSHKETGGPAFPACNEANVNGTMGMTLRDYFAGQALAGMMANEKRTGEHVTFGNWAKEAYYFADAMLAARKS